MAFGKKRAKGPTGRIEVRGYDGRPVVDPSPDALRGMVLALAGDTDQLVVVGSLEDRSGQTYVQVLYRSDGRWIVEHQAGSKELHEGAFVADEHAAADIVVAWATGDPLWHDAVDWQDGSVA
jgi:hypothetical protein